MGKIHYNAPVVLTYTFLSFAVLVLGYATDGQSTWLLFAAFAGPLDDPLFYIRLFGYALGHAGAEHFVGNFMLILLIGPLMEEKYGSANILKMILLTTLITSLLHVIFFTSALIGASGIVFMFIVLSSFVNLQRGRIPLTFLMVTAFFIGREVLDSMAQDDNIARITHIAGGLCGAAAGFIMARER